MPRLTAYVPITHVGRAWALGRPSDHAPTVANHVQDVSSNQMTESSFGLHVTAGATELPTRPIFAVVLFARAGIASWGDFNDPGAVCRGAVPSYGPYSVHASRNPTKCSQLVHFYKRAAGTRLTFKASGACGGFEI